MTLSRYLKYIFNIKRGSDEETTITEITGSVDLKGVNIWLLFCSAILTCIGLDTNSAAVIIGGMLISPLMFPILGIGLSIGINDSNVFSRSIKSLSFAVIITLISSFIYFKFTPLGDATSELLARTSPTLLDVLVAFFGGVAGIISISRIKKTSAIPGVAIATALMPPLCSTGYGLSLGSFNIYGGAFYLFFINAVFISISTYLIVKLLRFPLKSYMNKAYEKKVKVYMAIVLIIALFPSIYFLYTVYQKSQINHIINDNIIVSMITPEREIIKWNIRETDSVNSINIFYAGRRINDVDKKKYNEILINSGLDNFKINLVPINVSKDEIKQVSEDITREMLKTIELNAKSSEPVIENNLLREIYNEIKLVFPEIEEFSIGEQYKVQDDTVNVNNKDSLKTDTLKTLFVKFNSSVNIANKNTIKERITAFIKNKLNSDSLIVIEN
ncbi:MAG TPA: TIGR00341 family protein [Ignavibacteria bacterium]|nr:TIGR00341 family protein [Ignavibacteria bacterium]